MLEWLCPKRTRKKPKQLAHEEKMLPMLSRDELGYKTTVASGPTVEGPSQRSAGEWRGPCMLQVQNEVSFHCYCQCYFSSIFPKDSKTTSWLCPVKECLCSMRSRHKEGCFWQEVAQANLMGFLLESYNLPGMTRVHMRHTAHHRWCLSCLSEKQGESQAGDKRGIQ